MRALALAWCLLLPAPALADAAGEANTRFLWGRELYGRGRYREALDQFLVSNRLAPNPAPALGIARCFALLALPVEAYNAYAEYLSLWPPPADHARAREEAQALQPQVARLAVVTDPPGATLYLDRRNLGALGPSPRTVAAAPGAHKIIAELPGHQAGEAEVALRQGELVEVRLALARSTGRVHVASDPAGAHIRERPDGPPLGATPASLAFPLGARQLHLALPEHQPAQLTVVVEETSTATVQATLVPLPAPQGRLRVETNVVAALVVVNGEAAGFSPVVLSLREGPYTVTVQKPGFQPVSRALDVRAARTAVLEATLEPAAAGGPVGPVPWIMLAATTAAGAAGALLGVQALSAAAAYEDSAAPTRAQYDRVGRLNAATDVMLGLGLAGAAATALAFILEDSGAPPVSAARLSEEPAR